MIFSPMLKLCISIFKATCSRGKSHNSCWETKQLWLILVGLFTYRVFIIYIRMWSTVSPSSVRMKGPLSLGGAMMSSKWLQSDLQVNRYLLLGYIQLFVTSWTIAHEAPLFMGFSWQEYWSGLPFPSPGDLPGPGIKPASAGGFCTV